VPQSSMVPWSATMKVGQYPPSLLPTRLLTIIILFLSFWPARARSGGGGFRRRGGGGGESHEMSLLNGRRRLHELSNSMHLSELIRDAAARYFTLAVSNNFVKGRRSNYVIASCLYIACRVNQTNHMLIDFSEALQVTSLVGPSYIFTLFDG
jgi:hypothetical protein